MLFARPPEQLAGIGGAPQQSLVAFERVLVAPGQTVDLQLTVSSLSLSYASDDEHGSRVLPRGVWMLRIGPKVADASVAELPLLEGD